jgi:hypothetical protein
LSHYCNAAENDNYKRDVTWNNNLEETNLEDGSMVLERLEAELLGDHDGYRIPRVDMPPPSNSTFPNATVLPLSSHHPTLRGGHAATSRVP